MEILVHLILLGVAFIWGWTFVLVKESLAEIGTFAFLFYRFTLAFLLLLALFRLRLRQVDRRVWVRGALIGLALFSGYWFQTLGLNYTTATNSAFITGLSVVLVPLLNATLLREAVRGTTWLGSALSVLGLALLIFGSGVRKISLNVGDLLTMLCAVSFALHISLIGRFTRPSNYVPILIAQIGIVMLLSGLGMLAFEGTTYPGSWLVYKGLLITGIFATALAFWAQNRFQPLTTAGRTAIIFASEPAFAALFGYLFLGERLVNWQWLGTILILIAMVIAQLPSARGIPKWKVDCKRRR
jgi:drug/metabolite transporter (DMT)-like permease